MNYEREESRVSQGGEGHLRRLTFAEMNERDRVEAAGTPAELLARAEKAESERDRWIRAFNRLEKAVTSHRDATSDFQTEHDEALYAAHGSIMRTLCGTGETEL